MISSSFLARSSLRNMNGINKLASTDTTTAVDLVVRSNSKNYFHLIVYLHSNNSHSANFRWERAVGEWKASHLYRLAFSIWWFHAVQFFKWDALTREKPDPLDSENPFFQMSPSCKHCPYYEGSSIGVVVRGFSNLKIGYSNACAKNIRVWICQEYNAL